MLDGTCAFETLDPANTHIWWGAYVGMKEQVIDQGPLAEAGPRIVKRRATARDAHGWIMDIYLLRRR
jgi:precorrin-6A synthase